MVVTQWSLLSPDGLGSNPTIGNCKRTFFLIVDKTNLMKKMTEMAN